MELPSVKYDSGLFSNDYKEIMDQERCASRPKVPKQMIRTTTFCDCETCRKIKAEIKATSK